jgi:hypothetical protein
MGATVCHRPSGAGPACALLCSSTTRLIYVLLAAGAVTLRARSDYIDAGVIVGVVLINAVIGFVQEGKAEKALEAVSAMLASRATVLREGERHEIDAALLVPGDIVILESGDTRSGRPAPAAREEPAHNRGGLDRRIGTRGEAHASGGSRRRDR